MRFDRDSFFKFLVSRKCKIDDYDGYIREVEGLYKRIREDEEDYFYALLFLVGRKYCVTLGDIRDFFGLEPDYILSLSRKLARKYGIKYKWNVDACINRAVEYCGIKDENAEEVIRKFLSVFSSGRPDILIAFSVGFIYGCDTTGLFGTSLAALKYHFESLFGIKPQRKNRSVY